MKKIPNTIRAVFCFLCSALFLTCLQNNAWAVPRVSTERDGYRQGEEIRVKFSGAPGYASDWICIVPAGAPDTDAGDYQYTPNGAQEGYLTFTAPASGDYEVRGYFNYRRGEYLVSARYPFTVMGQRHPMESTNQNRYYEEEAARLSINKNTYTEGEEIRVRFSGAPGYASDWICLVPAGAPVTDGGNYQYMPNGQQEGYLNFTAPRPGNYEIRAYYNYRKNGYTITARRPFTVTSGFSSPNQGSDDSDPMLRRAQDALIERGYDPGEADGYYSKKTKQAIRDFQKDNDLKPTGTLDKPTIRNLGLLKSGPGW